MASAPSDPPATLVPRAVPVSAVFVWLATAMTTFKRHPLTWCALGLITLASKLGLELLPGIGRAASAVVVPVVECGLFIAAAAADRGGRPVIGHALAAFRAPPRALAAIVVSALAVTAAEAAAAYGLAGVNLLADASDADLTTGVLIGVLAAAILASLPVLFVPFAALSGGARFAQSFVESMRAFALNVAPLLLLGLLSLALTLVGLATFLLGLVAVIPLLALASYAAWKDIYPAHEPFRSY